MKKYLLFDLDGTLTDPMVGITTSVQYALHSMGIEEPDLNKLKPFIGPPLKDSFKEFYGMSDEQADRAIAKYRERFENTGIFENKVYKGIPEMLKRLQKNGFVLGVASSKPTVFVERILEHFHLREYFKVVVGSELDGTRVKKEEVLMEALNQLFSYKPIQYRQVYMIGDRKFDMEAAKALGVEGVGVSYGYGDVDELKAAKADYIVKSVDELADFLMRECGEAEESAQDGSGGASNRKKITFSQMWSILYCFLMFCLVRAIIMYLVDYLCFQMMWRLQVPGWLDSLLFFREEGMEKGIGFTGNQRVLKLMLGNAGAALFIFQDAMASIKVTAQENKLRFMKMEPVLHYVLLAGACVGTALGLNLFLDLAGFVDKSAAYQTVISDHYSANFWLGLISTGIVAPVCEELIFRGVVFNRFKRLLNPKAAMLISAVLFGFYHMNPVQEVYAFLIGCLIAYAYLYFGNFAITVIIHGGINILVYCLTYTPIVNGAFMSWPVCLVCVVVGVVCLFTMSRRKDVL